jgi:hypothetical protein
MAHTENKQYFTVPQANATLRDLNRIFEQILQLRALLKQLFRRLDDAGYAPRHVDLDDEATAIAPEGTPPAVARDLATFRGLLEALRECVEAIQRTGCIIKDLEMGLVDWPALHQGREVWLCWKYGETEVSHWHELHTGYTARRPISELDELMTSFSSRPGDTSAR